MTTAAWGTAVPYAPHRDTLKERHPCSLFSLANQPSRDAPKTLGLLAEVMRWKRRQEAVELVTSKTNGHPTTRKQSDTSNNLSRPKNLHMESENPLDLLANLAFQCPSVSFHCVIKIQKLASIGTRIMFHPQGYLFDLEEMLTELFKN